MKGTIHMKQNSNKIILIICIISLLTNVGTILYTNLIGKSMICDNIAFVAFLLWFVLGIIFVSKTEGPMRYQKKNEPTIKFKKKR